MTHAIRASCARVRGRLDALVADELDALEEARDRGHLEACTECARELAELERLRRSIRALQCVPAAELAQVHAEILARLPAGAPEPGRVPGRFLPGRRAPDQRMRFVLVAAAAVVLALLWSSQGLPSAPRVADLARLDAWLERLPAWSELLHGLGGFSRPLG